MSKYLHGVNLGGWLLLEKWMTPALFEGTDAYDEYTFMRQAGAKTRIENHRKTFITEADFKWLSDHNINFVRIPIGYWLFEIIDGFTPTVKYLDLAMQWAEKHHINVLIDLHGAQGSQNGKDHSGKIGKAEWFKDKSYQANTTELLCKIAKRYNHSSALWGIELLNEPHVLRHYFTLLHFYRQTYRELCKVLRPRVAVVFHDGFRSILFSHALRARKDHPVIMDVHWYAFFAVGSDANMYMKLLCGWHKLLLWYLQQSQPVIIGEWSSMLPGKYFRNVPPDQHDMLLRHYIDRQRLAFSKAAGYTYWSYKLDAGGMWNYHALIEDRVVEPPQK